MTGNEKINLLVIPDLFPKYKGDVQGVFIIDYLKSVKNYCDIKVLFLRIQSEKKGLSEKKTDYADITSYAFSEKKIWPILKPIYYLLFFIKGYSLGRKYSQINLIHCHGSILSGTLGYLISKRLKIPFIITEHQGPFSLTSKNFWKKTWTKFIMQRANAVLTVSEHLKQEILNSGIRPKNIIVTHNPVDTDLFNTKSNKTHYKNILFAGRLDEFKGAFRCVKAFELIYRNNPEWKLTIIGDGEEYNVIKNYLKKNEALNDIVILKGHKNKTELPEEMQNADFFLFPSRHESFGLVVAEAMACGLPVVVTNKTAPKEFVNRDKGLLINPDNISAIAEAMQTMIKNHSEYNLHNIRESIVNRFGFDSFGKKLRDIYVSFFQAN